MVGEAGRRFERRVFSGLDRWGVLPDGSLWVARVYDNRVDWRSPDGTWVRGEPLPDRVLEVTRYDRELFLRRFPPELRRTAQDLPFAAIKPPFEAGLTGSAGEVWLEKSRAPADSARRYHVVNRRGRLVREVRLPGQGRIIALGQGTALVAEPQPRRHPIRATKTPGQTLSIDEELVMKLGPAVHLALVAGIACRSAESQGVLTQEARLPARFGSLSNAVELRDGRVVFADTKNKLFLRGDFKTGKVDTLGTRVDSLNPSVREPVPVPRLGGASGGRHDCPGRLLRDPHHALERSRPPLGHAPDQGGRRPDTGAALRYAWARGYKIDYQAILGGGEPGRTLRPDSIPVLRIRLAGGTGRYHRASGRTRIW